MKSLIKYSCLIILLSLSWVTAFGQQGEFIDKDPRIAKFEEDIIIHLSKHNQDIEIKTPFNIEDYKNKIFVWKCLEIYSDTVDANLLLIQFRVASDHSQVFWGILTEKEKYFFMILMIQGKLNYRYLKRALIL